MLQFVLGVLFGFVAGCSLKDFILPQKNNEKGQNPQEPLMTNNEDFIEDKKTQADADDDNNFNLCTIQYIFDKYDVKLSSINSFSILLNKIERVAYKETLTQFSLSIKKPDDLFNLIEHGNTYNEIVKIQYSSNSILLPEKYINELLNKNSIPYLKETSLTEKIQALVSFHITKGLSQFQKTMGPSLGQFLSDYEENKDVSVLFEGIKSNINRALNLLS